MGLTIFTLCLIMINVVEITAIKTFKTIFYFHYYYKKQQMLGGTSIIRLVIGALGTRPSKVHLTIINHHTA